MAVPEIDLENVWKIYYYVAIFSTVLFVLKLMIFATVGGEAEVSADFNTETDTDCSFNFFSTQSVIAFFMGFGWMGYAGLQQFYLNQYINFPVAFAVGLIFMIINSVLMFATKKLEKNVIKDKKTAIQQVGRAYTNFEPHSMGQVEIEINGQLSVIKAMNNTEESINSFDLIRVVKVVDDILYIEKVRK